MKKLLPQIFHVTKTGAYGNEAPVFFARQTPQITSNPCVCWAAQKLARTLLYA
ncbi:hypothetical protein C4J89_4513 [Pseudomonas sp. R4-35-07]|nr:hypothetical protein C4J89_4513 [Pseudomonas sp. R4-35-07]